MTDLFEIITGEKWPELPVRIELTSEWPVEGGEPIEHIRLVGEFDDGHLSLAKDMFPGHPVSHGKWTLDPDTEAVTADLIVHPLGCDDGNCRLWHGG